MTIPMANKKSARSKGYRTYKKQPQGMTPKEKKLLIITAIAAVVILICILTIPDAIEASKYLKTKDGVVQDVGDNWLIKNTSSKKDYYLKVAEVGTPEGYELERVDPGISDDQQRLYYFHSTDEEPLADYYYIAAGGRSYQDLAEYSASAADMFATEVLQEAEVKTDVVGDKNIAYYVIEYVTADQDSDGNEISNYIQMASLYVESPIEGTSVVICASNTGDSEEAFVDDDALIDSMKPFVEALVIAESK